MADQLGRLPLICASLAATVVSLLTVVLLPSPRVFLPIAITRFAPFQSSSLTDAPGQDYLPSRIGTSSGVTLGPAISVGGLLAPALGAPADATNMRLGLVALAVAPTLRLRKARSRRRTAEQRRAV